MIRQDEHDDRRSGPARRASDRERVFTDAALVTWRVYELPARVFADTVWPPCLIFESPAVVRRLRAYPSDWRELPDAELDALVNAPGNAPRAGG